MYIELCELKIFIPNRIKLIWLILHHRIDSIHTFHRMTHQRIPVYTYRCVTVYRLISDHLLAATILILVTVLYITEMYYNKNVATALSFFINYKERARFARSLLLHLHVTPD